MSRQAPPHTQILVVGGGPGGSFAASVLAKEGFDVVVLEAARFPRYHIGESMLPSIRHFLDLLGAIGKIENHGFRRKVCLKKIHISRCSTISAGSSHPFQCVESSANRTCSNCFGDQWKREGYTDFGKGNHSWNVERAEFDEILLRHAEELGAKVYEEHRVTELAFADGATVPGRPVSATYVVAGSRETKTIEFDYLIDATGRAGLMSTRYMKNRKMNESLKNVACWGYWTNTGMYGRGTERHNAPWFEALTDESGWAWFIPLQNKVSVGIVMDITASTAKKAARNTNGQTHALTDHYLAQLDFVPRLKKLLDGAELVVDPTGTELAVRSASDFSYTATAYYGDHFRLVGDAACFIDPFLVSRCQTRVHLAISSGLTAAVTIAASIRGQCTEEEAGAFHDSKIAVSYTRFLLVVMGAYKQIRNQSDAVLSDIDEDNFDRAFDLIRPVIQGTADACKVRTENEMQKAMDFVTNIFVPTDPEMMQAVNTRLGMTLRAPATPIFTEDQIAQLAEGDQDVEHVIKQGKTFTCGAFSSND
ncbi:hypothetical protein HMN09_00403400 [Mycena chlorophos]|uniref:Halogenase n=1 Tax=Mycena chlorophos TaxID=658473 RepID=A0A8H6TFE1_MYCCL|nr:hypothetical protein HMN09_00403400 [Mycena chlorophos]